MRACTRAHTHILLVSSSGNTYGTLQLCTISQGLDPYSTETPAALRGVRVDVTSCPMLSNVRMAA